MRVPDKRRVLQVLRLVCIATVCLGFFALLGKLEAKKPDNPGGKPGDSGATIGDSTGKSITKYHLGRWNVKGDYKIVGPTIMVIDGDFDIGNNQIEITPTGSLELYIGGNIKARGNGAINNSGVPAQLLVFGTHPEKKPSENPDYSLTLSGNGALTGVVYAPNARYLTNGGANAGQTSGSVVALDIRFNGSPGPFHFDEALRDLDLGFGGYKLSTYRLKASGDPSPSEKSKAAFGSSNFASLFDSLF